MNVSPKIRTWLYGVVTAAVPVLVAYGQVGPDDAQLWLTLAAAVLGLGASATAVANRPTKGEPGWLPGEAEMVLSQIEADNMIGGDAATGQPVGPPPDLTEKVEATDG